MTRTAPQSALWNSKYGDGDTYVYIKFETLSRDVVRNDYNCRDQKGRKVGGFCIKTTERVDSRNKDDKGSSVMQIDEFEAMNADGVRYGYAVSATRNGNAFGASSHTKWFNTPEARDAAAEKAVDNARKRAQKKFK